MNDGATRMHAAKVQWNICATKMELLPGPMQKMEANFGKWPRKWPKLAEDFQAELLPSIGYHRAVKTADSNRSEV